MSQSLTNPLFVPQGTTFPLDGTENMIILQGEFVTQARLDDVIRAKVNGIAILAPVLVPTSSYNLSSVGINRIFVNFNGAVSIFLNTTYVVPGQDILIADRSGAASPANAITITATTGVTFDGDTSVVLNTPYGRAGFVYDGTNFIVVS
jgi:hypothetical protein